MADPELAAVENALSALALAETDGALERAVGRLLPGLLTALGTKSAAARARIIQALQHINVRVRGSPSLKLPFAGTLASASAAGASPMTANVALQGGYVARCFERLSATEKSGALLPLVRAAGRLSVRSKGNIDVLLSLAVRSLGKARGRWEAIEASPDAHVESLLEYCLRALRRTTAVKHTAAELGNVVGLCSEYAGVKQPARAAKVLPHLVVAAGMASESNIADAGVDALKRVDGTETLVEHCPSLVGVFFDLFKDPEASTLLRSVLMSKGLLRAPTSAARFDDVLSVLDLTVFSESPVPMRLRASGMQYLSYAIKHAPLPTLTANEKNLRKRMTDAIDYRMRTETPVRAFMYTALVQLVSRVPASASEHSSFLPEILFDAAQKPSEPAEVRAAAAQALVSLAHVFARPTADEKDKIFLLLTQTVSNQSEDANGARASAVLWANQCFPFDDAKARLLNIAASADQRTEVRDAALLGLNPKRFRGLLLMRDLAHKKDAAEERPVVYPKFSEIVSEVAAAAEGVGGLRLYPEAWASCFHFSLRTLKEEAKGDGPLGDIDTLARYVEKNAEAGAALQRLRSKADEFILTRKVQASSRIKRSALGVVLTVAQISINESAVAREYSSHIPLLLENCTKSSTSGDVIIVEAFANLVGVASAAIPPTEALALLKELGNGLEPIASGGPESRRGEHDRIAKLLCLGHAVREQVRKCGMSAFSPDIRSVCGKILCRVKASVESSQSVQAAACRAVALVGVLGPVFSKDGKDMLDVSDEESAVSEIAKVIKLTKSEPVLVEAGCSALGAVCVGEPSANNVSTALQTLFDFGKAKNDGEVQFTAAESLVQVATGLNIPPPRFLEDSGKGAEDDDLQELLLRRGEPLVSQKTGSSEKASKVTLFDREYALDVPGILDAAVNLCVNPRPTARACGGLFLFTFLKLIGSEHGDSVSKMYTFLTPEDENMFKTLQKQVGAILPKAHKSFTTLLGDRSDLVQQLASRGISLVYELSAPGAKEELVDSLVRSLTTTKSRAGSTVAGDEGGLVDLPEIKTSDGEATSIKKAGAATYKELCSLAQDMGQPDLIFKFMDLAGHAALWQSRRGAALAGSSLLNTELAAKQLRPHAATLIPRLYVYSYDAADGVKIAMSAVLLSVCKATGHTTVVSAVNAHFDAIVKHCLKCVTAKQWRVREAGCGAVRDTLSSRKWSDVEEWLKELWFICLRAMDDISERVRKQAWGFGQALSELSVTLCDPMQAGLENASKAVDIAVPALLSAFTHNVPEVRRLANDTLTKILKFGGEALRKCIPDIAHRMLESATEFEASILNYVQHHVEDKDALESARAQVASSSTQPWIEALDRIVGLVDESVAKELVPKILSIARSGVGVPTRAATARFFSSLLRTQPSVLKKYSPKMMKACLQAARADRNSALRKAWCAALGLAAGAASDEAVGKMCGEMAELGSSDDAKDRALASYLALGLWRQAPDVAKRHGTALLPVAYMGMFETDCGDEVVSNWVDVWSEGCPSSDAGLRIYAVEITDICVERLDSSTQYKVKQCMATVLGALADASNKSTNVDLLAKGADALMNALPARLFEGKEAYLEALGSIAECSKGSEVWGKVGGAESVILAFLKECFRGKQAYKSVALANLPKILKSTRSPVNDFFETVVEKVAPLWDTPEAASDKQSAGPVIVKAGDNAEAEAVQERNNARKTTRANLVAAILGAEAAYVGEKSGDKGAQETHFKALLGPVGRAMQHERDVRGPVLDALASAVGRSAKATIEDTGTMDALLKCAEEGVRDSRFAKVRRSGIALMEKVKEKVGGKVFCEKVGAELKALISTIAKKETEPAVQAEAEKMRKVLI